MALTEIGARLRLAGAPAFKKDTKAGADGLSKMARAAGQADRKVSGLERSARRVGSVLGSLGKGVAIGGLTALAVGAAGVSAAFAQGFRDAAALQTMLAKTNAVIASTRGVANVSAKSVRGLADQLESLSGIEGDSIINAQNLLLTFTNVRNGVKSTDKVFDQATRTLVDMAAALGSDPAGAAIQLGKALNDPVKGVSALGEVGVSFTEKQKKLIQSLVDSGKVMEAQKVILKELSVEFGGAAKAAGSGFEGALFRVKDAFRDAFRDTATPLLPIVTRGIEALAVRTGVLGKRTTEWAGALVTAFEQGGMTGAVRKLDALTGAGGDLERRFKGLQKSGGDLKVVLRDVILPTAERLARALGKALEFAANHTTTAYVALGLLLARTKLLIGAKILMLGYATATGVVAAAQGRALVATTATTGAIGAQSVAARANAISLGIMGTAAGAAMLKIAALTGALGLGAVAAYGWLKAIEKANKSESNQANAAAGVPTATIDRKPKPKRATSYPFPTDANSPYGDDRRGQNRVLTPVITPPRARTSAPAGAAAATAPSASAPMPRIVVPVMIDGRQIGEAVIDDLEDRMARRR